MKLTTLEFTACACFLTGCTTTYIAPPDVPAMTLPPGTLQLKNEQIDTEPRLYFSDGIATLTTHYRGYTEVLMRSVRERLGGLKITDPATKSLGLSIQSISCTGHYVPDCTVAAVVSTGGGLKRGYSGTKVTGYPIASALDKAINTAAATIAADPDVIAYLSK